MDEIRKKGCAKSLRSLVTTVGTARFRESETLFCKNHFFFIYQRFKIRSLEMCSTENLH